MVKKHVVAIDGPAGVGKTSTSKSVARRLGYIYIDTGAMYRAIAWKSLQDGIDPSDRKGLAGMLKEMKFKVKPFNNRMRILVEGKDVTGRLRARSVTDLASKVAAVKKVREYLVDIQRRTGAKGGVVMEGRDIGTVVFPDTPFKFFLTASVEARAKRRYLELREQGGTIGLARIKKDIAARDRRDRTRKTSPLLKAKDAVLVDSTNLTKKEVVDCIIDRIK